MTFKVKRIEHEGVKNFLPKKATRGSAGLDLFAAIASPVTIEPGCLVSIPTGIAVGLQDSKYAGFVFARSGLGIKHGITLSNGVGVIDSDYTGEISVGLCNISKEPYTLEPGERIAQLVIMPVVEADFVEVSELEKTSRSDKGFGSTGRF